MLSIRALLLAAAATAILLPDQGMGASKRLAGLSALIGNTVHGYDLGDGQEYWSYHNPDGTGANLLEDGEKTTFTWTITGDTLCETYQEPPVECSKYQINGNSGIQTSTAGTSVGAEGPIQIMPGNPKSL